MTLTMEQALDAHREKLKAAGPEATAQCFNNFCRVTDKLLRPLVNKTRLAEAICKVIDTAPLFTFDAQREQVILAMAKSLTADQRHLPPGMPFDQVMLADTQGVVAFFDHQDYEEGELVIAGKRVYRTMRVMAFISHPDMTEHMPGAFSLNIGTVQVTEPEGGNRGYFIVGNLDSWVGMENGDKISHYESIPEHVQPLQRDAWMADRDAGYRPEDLPAALKRDFISSLDCGLDQLHYVNLPKHYLVVNTPAHVREKKSQRSVAPKAPRFQDRPHVMLIDPEKVHVIRPRGESKGGEHASPVPHLRRGHTKTLKSEKFKNKRWAVVHIHPTWVGDIDWTNGRIHYHVIVRGKHEQSGKSA